MRVASTFILLTGVVLATATLAPAQQTRSTTERLLDEVRQLRLALERQVSVGARVQLITGRAAMQDGRVSRLSQQLDDVRGELMTVDRQIKDLERRARGIEDVLAVESDPAHRHNAAPFYCRVRRTSLAGRRRGRGRRTSRVPHVDLREVSLCE